MMQQNAASTHIPSHHHPSPPHSTLILQSPNHHHRSYPTPPPNTDDDDDDSTIAPPSLAAPDHHDIINHNSNKERPKKKNDTIAASCAHIVSHWKILLFGQILSFLVSICGMASATLHFECDLSAPTAQSLFVYLFMSFHGFCLCRERKRQREMEVEVEDDDDDDDEMGGGWGSGGGGEMMHERQHDHKCEHEKKNKSSSFNPQSAPTSNNKKKKKNNTHEHHHIHHSMNPFSSYFQSLQAPWWMYFLIALLDVEANFFTFLSFRYTTFTSISLFDSLAIPSAMAFSTVLLRRDYRFFHMAGACICLAGVVLNVLSDYEDGLEVELEVLEGELTSGGGDTTMLDDNDDDDKEAGGGSKFPHKVWGDLLAITGGIMYGLNDVLAELCVKSFGGMQEYLSALGLFGFFISAVQMFILERHALSRFFKSQQDHDATDTTHAFPSKASSWSMNTYINNGGGGGGGEGSNPYYYNNDDLNDGIQPSECSVMGGITLLFAYALAKYLSYVGVARFLVVSESALLNLSLLTGDLWAVIFTILAENLIPHPLFWLALLLIISGVFIYEMSPSPIVDDDDFNYDHHHHLHALRTPVDLNIITTTTTNHTRRTSSSASLTAAATAAAAAAAAGGYGLGENRPIMDDLNFTEDRNEGRTRPHIT